MFVLGLLLYWSALLVGVAKPTLRNSPENVCSVCECAAKSIDCSDRRISYLPSFQNAATATANATTTTMMMTITFAHCTFTRVPQLPKLPVRILSFAHNDITKIDDAAFKNLANLQSLDLSYNVLTADTLLPNVLRGNFAPDQYEPLRSLRVLNLAHNQFHTLHHNVFEHLVNLEVLKLNENPLKIITPGVTAAISSLPCLKELDLSRTQIKKIPETIFHAPKFLEILNLSFNLFTNPPEELENSHRLRWLSLDGNPIKRIRTFINLPFLKQLHISKMPELVSIEERALSQMPLLEKFYCSNNKKLIKIAENALSAVHSDEEGETWPLLTTLVLSNNSLESIESHLVARWDNLEVINLQNNPWLCDCENQWLVSTLAPIIEKTQPEMMASFKCAKPVEMKNLPILELSHRHYQMRCLDLYNHTPEKDVKLLMVISMVAIILAPLLMAAAVYYKRRQRDSLRSSKLCSKIGFLRYSQLKLIPEEKI